MMALPLRRRFTVAEYEGMAEARILAEDDRVELIDGEVVVMSPTGSRHAACVDRCAELFGRRLGTGAIVRVQGPVQLGEYTALQPDVALLRRRSDFYETALPGL